MRFLYNTCSNLTKQGFVDLIYKLHTPPGGLPPFAQQLPSSLGPWSDLGFRYFGGYRIVAVIAEEGIQFAQGVPMHERWGKGEEAG